MVLSLKGAPSKRAFFDELEELTMLHLLKAFRDEDSGAVSIDWVVLTAAIVALAIAAWTTIDDATLALHANTTAAVQGQQ